MANSRVEGISTSYLEILSRLHTVLEPRTYVEIGTQKGASLRLACCATLAIDPKFDLEQGAFGHKPSCMLFEMSSDRFFENHDLSTLLGKIDLAFLDGMHLYEFLLRDFMHVETHCKKNSVIAIHDIVPSDIAMAGRETSVGAAWTGDVWKTALILKKYRPDLGLLCLDADPTGLMLVTNLNPASRLLSERYFSLIEEFRELSLESLGIERLRKELSVAPSTIMERPEAILSRFWL